MPPRSKNGGGGCVLFFSCLSFCHSLWIFNLANNFRTVRARALIFNISISYDQIFPWFPLFFTLTLEFDPCFENFNLAITFEQWVLELWYCTWVLLVIRPFRDIIIFYTDLDLEVWPIFIMPPRSKVGGRISFSSCLSFCPPLWNFNLANNFWTVSAWAMIFHMNIPW